MIKISSPALFFVTCLLLAGCTQNETVETWGDGRRKLVREYSWPGAKDSLHLRAEISYFVNGEVEWETHYRQGKVEGEFKAWWPNGQLKAKGDYTKGQPDGLWEYYYNTYVLAAKGSFNNGLKEGPWTEYWENSELKRQGSYRNGKETGEWAEWISTGGEVLRNSCFESNAFGHTLSNYQNGSLKEKFDCRLGKRAGPYLQDDPEGGPLCRGFYDTAGKQDSIWLWFHRNGRLYSRQHFVHGLRNDSLMAWDSSGRVAEKGFFKMGTGVWNHYDSLGHLRETKTYEKGHPLSLKRWHANLLIEAEGSYLDGKKTGTWRLWDEKGRLREAAEYLNGELHGNRNFFDSTGDLNRLQRYYHGMPTRGSFPKIPGGK